VIGHYWMARELSELGVEEGLSGQECTIQVRTKCPTDNFTPAVPGWAARRVQMNGRHLYKVNTRRDIRNGTFLAEGKEMSVFSADGLHIIQPG